MKGTTINSSTVSRITYTTVVGLLTIIAANTAVAGTLLADTLLIAGKDRIVASGKAERFDRSSIFEYSDGGADIYLDAGFVVCGVRQYNFRGSVKGSIEIAAYDMKTPLRAVGLFQTLAEEHTVSMSGNLEMMSDVRRVVFHKSEWLVEIVDKSDSEVPGGTLAKAAIALGATLPGSPGVPAEYSRLPHMGKTAGSERYYHRNFLSRSYLPCALTARYMCETVPCTLFVSQNDSSGAAHKGMEKLAASLNTIQTSDTILAPSLTAVVKGAYIFGVTGRAERKKVMDLIRTCMTLVP
jgi:hypothetical protein